MKQFEKAFPWLMVGIAVLYFGVFAWPRSDRNDDFHYHEFSTLPVQEGGRLQPMDTFARTRLMQVSNRQTFRDYDPANEETQDGARGQPAVKWLLDAMVADLGPASKLPTSYMQKVFRIENDQVITYFRLKPRAGLRYRPEELLPRMKEFANLMEHLDHKKENAKKELDTTEIKFGELARRWKAWMGITKWFEPHVIPPQPAGSEAWLSLAHAAKSQPDDAALAAYETMLRAYSKQNVEQFNTALAKYRERLEQTNPGAVNKTGFEAYFNGFAPFYHCLAMYVLVFLLVCGSWLGWAQPLSRAAFWVAALTLAVHTWGILARMMIMGRPPVTNLYASAVFIGWGCVALGLTLTWMFRNTIPLAVAAVTGLFTLIVADNLITGDTMDVLLPVLDTNIWLATHVVIITIGYTATFVAGFLGAAMIIMGVVTPALTSESMRTLTKMIYGVVCFATLLSFTGTVLGGIWADQSWGRFWGWDPKENGALLIVVWNALVLHARWGGMIKQRGLAVLAVGGNIVTAWSWFGTNMLPVGLHNYGRMDGAVAWLLFFMFLMLLIMAAGMLPFKSWYSFAPKPPVPPLAGGGSPRGMRGDLRTGVKSGVAVGGAASTGIRTGVART